VFEQPWRDRVAALVRGRVACAHDHHVVHEHPCLQVEVPEAPVLEDVSDELQHVYSPLGIRQGQIAFVAKYYQGLFRVFWSQFESLISRTKIALIF